MGPPPTNGPEPGYFIAKSVLVPWLASFFRWHWEGTERIPAQGPAIIASNHVSLFDPLAVAYGIHKNGRRPRFFAKSSLFQAPVVGWVLKSANMIRVDRGTASAPASLDHAEAALRQGEVVAIFPEGTTTKAEDLTPLPPKSGVARLALKTGVSVIPCATWGGQWAWSYHLGFRPLPGKDIWVRFGDPVSLEEYEGREDDRQAIGEVSRKVMDEILSMVAELRAAKPWTPRPLSKRSTKKLKKQGRL